MSSIRRLSHAFAFISLTLVGTAGAQIITTIAGGALPATPLAGVAASTPQPQGVATDAAGNVYLSSGHVVYKLDTAGTLTRVAGTGTGGYSGDASPATSAQLEYPIGLAVDAGGNLYIADLGNNRVRKVSASGIITTVAGSGVYGYSGDRGPAIGAQLNDPSGVAVDASGSLYIADRDNNCIRKVSAAGTITTVAGNGSSGYSGDGGPATSAQFNVPYSVAVDASGNLYVADDDNHRVRKVSAAGIITTVAGTGSSGYSGDGGPAASAQLWNPLGVTVDAGGNLYITDSYNNRVRKVSAAGVITTVAGSGTGNASFAFSGDGGPATSAKLNEPWAVAVDAGGNLYVTDTANNRVRKVSAAGTITTVAGGGYDGDGGSAVLSELNDPFGVAADSAGNVYIADNQNYRVRKISAAGIITTVAGTGSPGYSGDGGPATNAQFFYPSGLAVDVAGNVYIADNWNHSIRKVSPAGFITTVAGSGTFGSSGDGGPAASARLAYPYGVAVDANGNLYIADTSNHRVRKVSASGIITTIAGTGSSGYSGDGGPATSAQLYNPYGVAVDAAGNLYIADTYNHCVRKVSPSGIITTVAGNGVSGYSGDGVPGANARLGNPYGVAVDASGNLYIADSNNCRIRKVSTAGIITTVAGNGYGYAGDGGPATSATLSGPESVAVAANGNLYIADSSNNRIRLIAPQAGPPAVTSVVNAAGFQTGAVAPGEIISIFGSSIGPAAGASWQFVNGVAQTTLAQAVILFNGTPAPLIYVSANQINAIVPYEVAASGTASMQISYQGNLTSVVSLSVAATAPGLFTADGSGSGAGAILNSDSSLNTAANPAAAGSILQIFATGEGVTNPASTDGKLQSGATLPKPVAPVSVTIGGQPATVAYAGTAPGSVAGFLQVNAVVPTGLPSGPQPIVLKVGNASSQAGVTVVVQ